MAEVKDNDGSGYLNKQLKQLTLNKMLNIHQMSYEVIDCYMYFKYVYCVALYMAQTVLSNCVVANLLEFPLSIYILH